MELIITLIFVFSLFSVLIGINLTLLINHIRNVECIRKDTLIEWLKEQIRTDPIHANGYQTVINKLTMK